MSTIQDRFKIVIHQVSDGNKSEFSRKIGVTYATVLNLLKGKSNFDLDALGKIAELGINIHWLITGKGEMLIEKSGVQVKYLQVSTLKLIRIRFSKWLLRGLPAEDVSDIIDKDRDIHCV